MAALLLSDRRLRAYLDDVRAWHGYVRFLGLPTIQDHPDTPLTDLFVVPVLSRQRVSPESMPNSLPESGDVFTALESQQKLVILGDPGSGKSMIVNWLAWLLSGGADGVLPRWLEDVLPIPLVVRELKLDGVRTFDELMLAFFDRPVAAHLSLHRDLLRGALEEGRALVLLDGLDEVPLALRESLRAAVFDGWHRYPGVLFLATSRIVGYDECPLGPIARDRPNGIVDEVAEPMRSPDSQVAAARHPKSGPDDPKDPSFAVASTFYVMPFDDARIKIFAQQWYRLRSIKPSADQDAGAFVRAIHAEPSVLELARSPQLLTLMALVYRVRAHLPDGRAMLYDLITEAYLESIDRARLVGAVTTDHYPWREKRRWLARVGFELQMLRGEQPDSEPTARELLATREQVLDWVRDAMRLSSYPADDAFAAAYLDWVARRSGLLLPRGEDLFAFVHLSFQEYFAALYVLEHVSDADWVIAQRDRKVYAEGDERVTSDALATWSADVRWQETLVFAQECFANNPRDARRFSEWLFGPRFAAFSESLRSTPTLGSNEDPGQLGQSRSAVRARGELLGRLLTNPHSGLTASDRAQGTEAAMQYLEQVERLFGFGSHGVPTSALRRLLSSSTTRAEIWSAIRARDPEYLNLSGSGHVDPSHFRPLTRLRHLTLDRVEEPDLAALAELERLDYLWLINVIDIASIAPLGALRNLQTLGVGYSHVADLEPLAHMRDLTYLYMSVPSVSDIGPLRGLARLESLWMNYSKVKSLDPLRKCKALRVLSLSSNPIDDLSPLDDLPNLVELHISATQALTPRLRARQAAGHLKVTVDGR